MPLTVQKRNPELIDLLSADFQRRYEPNFAWVNACSAISLLPGLRGFWPMSANIKTGLQGTISVTDIINNFHLAMDGDPLYMSAGLAPYLDFNGVNQYLYYPDVYQFSILGTEAYIQDKGLTLGCWAYLDAWGAAIRPLMTKWQAANQFSYYLGAASAANQTPYFSLSNAGVAVEGTVVSSLGVGIGAWTFLCGRFIPSTSACIWVNSTKTTSVAAIPASLFDSTSNLEIARGLATDYLDGRVSLAWLCASALTDTQIWAIYQQTRALYGA